MNTPLDDADVPLFTSAVVSGVLLVFVAWVDAGNAGLLGALLPIVSAVWVHADQRRAHVAHRESDRRTGELSRATRGDRR